MQSFTFGLKFLGLHYIQHQFHMFITPARIPKMTQFKTELTPRYQGTREDPCDNFLWSYAQSILWNNLYALEPLSMLHEHTLNLKTVCSGSPIVLARTLSTPPIKTHPPTCNSFPTNLPCPWARKFLSP
jgi:hypothetical protein